jgi:hypothetical protein
MLYSQNLLPGNIIPNKWYKKFIGPDGPDLVCITLLADIIALYRFGHNIYESNNPNSPKFTGDSLSLSYEYFEEKFGFSKERTRRALVRLENLNILKREIYNIRSSLNKRVNRLFIVLDSVFFNSCFRNAELDIRVEPKSRAGDANIIPNNNDTLVINPNSLTNTHNLHSNAFSSTFRSPRPCGDHIRSNKNTYKKNRSIACAKSNFLKNFSNSFLKENDPLPNNLVNCTSSNFQDIKQTRSLKGFYPLSEQDCSKLQSLSGRDFSLKAMNEILLDMSERLKDRWFKSKTSFLNYMSKAFKYEMRDALKVSNETFRIKRNSAIEDQDIQERIKNDEETARQEKYLTELESRREVTAEMHLKKKLACVLERSKAYKLLTAYKFGKRVGEEYELYLSKAVPELTEHDKRLILEQVKATQQTVDFSSFEFGLIKSIKIIEVQSGTSGTGLNNISSKPSLEKVFEQMTSKELAEKLRGQGGIWDKARAGLIEYLNDYKDSGKWIDKNWFSKLEAEVNEEQKTIKLKAPTSFIARWISNNYASLMERTMADYGYEVEMC